MRYSASHKAEIREKLVKAAGALSKEKGFGVTGVDALMATVGLSGGAFYGHFKTKGDLLEAIVDNELGTTQAQFLGAATAEEQPNPEPLIRRYLSRAHLEHPAAGCALPTLSPEVARADHKVKASYEARLLEIHSILTGMALKPEQAWALLALVVGGITLARAVPSATLQQQILDACIDQALATLD